MENNFKKRKIDDIDLDLNLDLDKLKSTLYQQKKYHENQISIINSKLIETNLLISKKCKKINGSHKWITEREEGIYGEKFRYCKNCRVDIYDNNFFH